MLEKTILSKGVEEYDIWLKVREGLSKKEIKRFEEEYINKPERLFQVEGNEEEVLNFYDKCLDRIKQNSQRLRLIRIKGKYLEVYMGEHFFNNDKTKGISIYLFGEYSIETLREIAVRNLTSSVQEGLDMGDKKIIKDVALSTLSFNLKHALKGDVPDMKYLIDCVMLDCSVKARNSLRRYGFRLKDRFYSHHFNTANGEPCMIKEIDLRRDFTGD